MRILLGLVSVCLLAACGSTAGDGEPGTAATPPPTVQGTQGTQGTWERTVGSALSPREGSVAARVGAEAVFVGGYAGPPCPPGADCAVPPADHRRDGAAYDPGRGTWRRIADAPRRIPPGAVHAVVDGELFVHVDGVLLAWRGDTDSWREVALPDGAPSWLTLTADGDRLVVASGSDEQGEQDDVVLDTASGRWTTLPPDPLTPSYDRVLTATPAGLVLTAHQLLDDGAPADPSLVRAAVLPPGGSTWRTLPTSDQLGGSRWAWTGQRLVDITLGGADGGEVDGYGRVIPFGGRLDVARGVWSRLPDAPDERAGGWPVEAWSGPAVAGGGWLYDDRTSTWASLPVPDDAPAEPGPAVWVDDRLVVLGGADWDDADPAEVATPARVWSTDIWTYTPR